MALEQDKPSPYRRFLEGDNLLFILYSVCADGSLSAQEYSARISAIRGGGFVGKVLFFDGLPLVLKTPIPDPWHDLWRRINWGVRDFPPQVREVQAQQGHLSVDLIGSVLSPITHGKYRAPRSYGYAHLDGGFAQGIERLYGRPPRYDNGVDEFRQFRQAQQELTTIAYTLGLEQVGQIHPDNLYAMANLLKNEKTRQFEWVDLHPAIRHTGWVWPFFYFRFHHQIRRYFHPDNHQVTFNRIHTDMFLKELRKHQDLFCEEDFRRIEEKAEIYEGLWQESQKQLQLPRNYKGLAIAAGWSAAEFGQAIILNTKKSVTSVAAALVDPTYLRERVLDGAREAFRSGTITQTEWQEAVSLMQQFSEQERGSGRFLKMLKGASFFGSLYAYYHGSGLLLKVPEFAAYANFGLTDIAAKILRFEWSSLVTQEDWLQRVAIFSGIFAGARMIGGLNSYLGTKFLSRLTGRNLDTAAGISAIPGIGIHLAIPAQICVDAGSKSKTIWHSWVRKVVSKISQINPAGGWGTELEGKTWHRIGGWLEGLAKYPKLPNSR